MEASTFASLGGGTHQRRRIKLLMLVKTAICGVLLMRVLTLSTRSRFSVCARCHFCTQTVGGSYRWGLTSTGNSARIDCVMCTRLTPLT